MPFVHEIIILASFATTLLRGAPCKFDGTAYSVWRYCDCQPLSPESGKVFCRHVSWLTVPTMPPGPMTLRQTDSTILYPMTSLTIVESGLVWLRQDDFKGQNIQQLDLSHNDIQNVNERAFSGLESKLYQLALSHNSLDKIPVDSLRKLYSLNYLYLRHNHITRIPATTFREAKLKSLRFLYLDNNLISRIPRGAFNKLALQLLTLGNNRIASIDPAALPSTLWYLNLKNNALNDIPFPAIAEMTKLASLDLEGNNLTHIEAAPDIAFTSEISLLLSNNRISTVAPKAFQNFRKITILDLSYNQLRHLPAEFLDGVDQLKTLDLSYNHLVKIPINAFIHVGATLKTLKLAENEFHTIPLAFRSLVALEVLNMNSNKLIALQNGSFSSFKGSLKELQLGFNSLSIVPRNILEGMTNLSFLDLSKNQISDLSRFAFGTSFDNAVTSLVELNLAGNKIQKITKSVSFLYMTSLAHLDLSYNMIEKISARAFSKLSGLERLFLQNNKISVFPTEALQNLLKLRYLILDNNLLMAIPEKGLEGLAQLEQLSIARNNLHAVSYDCFSGAILKRLKLINLGHNRIMHLAPGAFNNMSSVEVIRLEYNFISSLNSYSFSNMPNLRQVVLNRNRVNETEKAAFTNLPSLDSLFLSRNRLAIMHRETLEMVPHLEVLDLSNNQFVEFLPHFLMNVKSLKTLDLSNNKLDSVHLSYFRHSLEKLNLRHNRFQVITADMVAEFAALRSLDFSKNQLVDIQGKAFFGTPRLSSLILSWNFLSDFRKGTFAQQEIYSILDLSHNSIRELGPDIFGLDNIYKLDLSFNALKTIPYTALHSVRRSLSELSLQRNLIENLESKYFEGLNNLTTLILSQNRVQNIEEAAFKSTNKIRKLDLSENPVTSWHPLVFRDLGHSIETLNLAATGLYSLPEISRRGIRHLNLSGNYIHDMSTAHLAALNKLMTLDLSHNKLEQLDRNLLDPLVNLKKLNLSHNPLLMLELSHLKALHKLDSLRLHDMPYLLTLPPESAFKHLRNLRELHLFSIPGFIDVSLSEILAVLPPLRSLYIEIPKNSSLENTLILKEQLHAADFRFLRDFLITGKGLTEIDAAAFHPLRGYKVYLTITDTSITSFPSPIFGTLTRVSNLYLDLRNNKLDGLSPFPYTKPPILNLHGTILAQLKLSGNPLSCDCRLHWVKPWMNYLEGFLSTEDLAQQKREWNRTLCATHVAKKSVINLRFSNLGCAGSSSREQLSPVSIFILHFALFLMGLFEGAVEQR